MEPALLAGRPSWDGSNTMDDRGQVYFNADDKEVQSEDAARYERALAEDGLEAIREHYRLAAERAWERERTPTDKQRAHIEARTRFEAALRKEAEARFGTGEQEA